MYDLAVQIFESVAAVIRHGSRRRSRCRGRNRSRGLYHL
jgi:hypothetical protein